MVKHLIDRRTRQCVVVAVALLRFCVNAIADDVAPAPCTEDTCIQIGSFNIKYLGGQDRTGDELTRLADLISTEIGYEVVVLQEINTESDEWRDLKELLADRGYEFFEGSSSDRNQFLVLAWQANAVNLVSDSASELQVSSRYVQPDNPECSYEGLRLPIAGQFSAGEFDFWVVGVHLKSRSRGRGANKLPRGCPSWVREQQGEDLIEAINRLEVETGEADMILVGDFNENRQHDSLRPFRMAGFTTQMAYRMPRSGTCSYLPSCPNDLIDHVWLSYSDTAELIRNSGFVYVPENISKFIQVMSDHAPVWSSFSIEQDMD